MPVVCQLSAWGTYYQELYFPDGTMSDFVCNSMIARWFFVKFLWEVQSLDNSVSQKFYQMRPAVREIFRLDIKAYWFPIQNYFIQFHA